MERERPLAKPDYEKYEGLEIQRSRGAFSQLLLRLSLFRGRELANVLIAFFGLAILYKSDLTETVQIVIVLSMFCLGIGDVLRKDSNAASDSKTSESQIESRHARRGKGTA